MSKCILILVLLLGSTLASYGAQSELRGVYMEITNNQKFGVLPLVQDGDWRRLCRNLKLLGINAIFPNVVSPAGALYPSDVVGVQSTEKNQRINPNNKELLATSDKVELPQEIDMTSSDILQKIITAAHNEGLEVHAWTIEWFKAPKSTDPSRLMQDAAGNTTNTLCPSQPVNSDLMRRMIMELVQRYDVDGIQYDYMRFPSNKYCYCRHCREGFEKILGRPVPNWLAEVTPGGQWEKKYLDYLYGTLNSFVREMYPLIKKLKPKIAVSAAVWAKDEGSQVPSVRQDWGEWVRAGALDFIVPMNYGNDWILSHYEEFARNEARQVAGKIPLVFGLGAYADTPEGLVSAVKSSRDLKGSGFIIYTLTEKTFREHLPELHQKVWSGSARVPSFGRLL